MKQIFTLLVLAVLSTFSLNAQINETFENYSSIANLTNNCWQFVWVDLSNQNVVTAAKSLRIIPTTSQSNNTQSNISQIVSPYINFSASTSISFNYKMGSRLSNNATRTMVVKLQDLNGTTETIGTIQLNNASNTNLFSFSYTSTTSSIRKLVWEIVGSGDGNSYMHMDDLLINSTYNYTPAYACDSYNSNIILPIKLLSFNGNLVNNKASLQWSVADNETGAYFEVQKSNDGKMFNTVAVVFVSRKNGTENYSFTDTKDLGSEGFYKIKIVNNNGSTSQSRVVLLKSQTSGAANSLVILQNPVESTLMFTYSSATSGKSTVNIYNAMGARMLTTTANFQTGVNAVSINLDGKFISGTYLLEVINGSERSVSKLIKK
jgi:hypothetical protein